MVLEYDEMMDGQASGLWTRLDVNIKHLQPNPFEMNLNLYTVIRTISKISPASSTTKTGRHDIPASWNISESGVEHQNSKIQFQMSFTYVLRSELSC
jgi:hypothetical protein